MFAIAGLTGIIPGIPGGPEVLVILLIGLLLFGGRLPEVGRSLGKSLVEFRKGLRGLKEEVGLDNEVHKIRRDLEEASRIDPLDPSMRESSPGHDSNRAKQADPDSHGPDSHGPDSHGPDSHGPDSQHDKAEDFWPNGADADPWKDIHEADKTLLTPKKTAEVQDAEVIESTKSPGAESVARGTLPPQPKPEAKPEAEPEAKPKPFGPTR